MHICWYEQNQRVLFLEAHEAARRLFEPRGYLVAVLE